MNRFFSSLHVMGIIALLQGSLSGCPMPLEVAFYLKLVQAVVPNRFYYLVRFRIRAFDAVRLRCGSPMPQIIAKFGTKYTFWIESHNALTRF